MHCYVFGTWSRPVKGQSSGVFESRVLRIF
jgi:hypothetical protein